LVMMMLEDWELQIVLLLRGWSWSRPAFGVRGTAVASTLALWEDQLHSRRAVGDRLLAGCTKINMFIQPQIIVRSHLVPIRFNEKMPVPPPRNGPSRFSNGRWRRQGRVEAMCGSEFEGPDITSRPSPTPCWASDVCLEPLSTNGRFNNMAGMECPAAAAHAALKARRRLVNSTLTRYPAPLVTAL
jgi:hypothetical protein